MPGCHATIYIDDSTAYKVAFGNGIHHLCDVLHFADTVEQVQSGALISLPMPDEAPVTMIVCFFIILFFISDDTFFSQYGHLFSGIAPIIQINFKDNHMG
ncbi:hypothetical protein CLV51_1011703 [Chitinophaga niastensis]|uniref:Uncharacterized protein n=1 Tax=Chitinophaga niastensis TaxID=536980 RepID=A0A2P8HW14_CHINA|nr:hypothetical protein CLV51_1011703 [Chitinophaga niastensis]